MLEQLELLEMLESHIERLKRAREVARDLAAISKDRQDGGEMAKCRGFSVLSRQVKQLLSGRAGPDTTRHQALEPLACPNWPYNATRGDFRSRPTRLAWRANSPRAC
jgi:hypothetical protein